MTSTLLPSQHIVPVLLSFRVARAFRIFTQEKIARRRYRVRSMVADAGDHVAERLVGEIRVEVEVITAKVPVALELVGLAPLRRLPI